MSGSHDDDDVDCCCCRCTLFWKPRGQNRIEPFWDRTGKAGWLGWDGLTCGPDYGDDLFSNGSLVLAPVLSLVLGAGELNELSGGGSERGSYQLTVPCYTWTMGAEGIEVLLHTLYLHPAGSKLGSPVRMGPSPLPEASCLSSSEGPSQRRMGPRPA